MTKQKANRKACPKPVLHFTDFGFSEYQFQTLTPTAMGGWYLHEDYQTLPGIGKIMKTIEKEIMSFSTPSPPKIFDYHRNLYE